MSAPGLTAKQRRERSDGTAGTAGALSGEQPLGAADQRREQILAASLEVIAERGFPDSRIADVAERVGASPALVLYYFKTKDNLLTEAMRYAEDSWYDAVSARMKQLATASERLEEIVRVTCLPEQDAGMPESWSLWLDLWAQSVRHPEVAKVRAQFDERWRTTIASIVREGSAAGELPVVDEEEFALCFSALLDGLAVQIALSDDVVTPERAVEVALAFARLWLDGPAGASGSASGSASGGRSGSGRRSPAQR